MAMSVSSIYHMFDTLDECTSGTIARHNRSDL